MDADEPIGAPHDERRRDPNSIGYLFSRLIDDAERFVRAEINLYRAEAFARINEAKLALLLGVTAFLLAQAALIALLVGLLLIARRLMGPTLATLTVVGGALIVAGLMVAVAVAKIKQITRIKDGPA
ncbi:phage holin family protein [Sphingomonas sp. RT2P30]|uniref:phage holin family protein n=1 Tax=Parasphingomonas halimpatiens TaxID=3096162 RepID=UPI002FCA8E2A